MFKLDMKAIRQSAGDAWLMANAANVANVANESGKNGAEISQQPLKLAGLAKLAISQQPVFTFQARAGAINDPTAPELKTQPCAALPVPVKPKKQTFMEWQDTWRELDQAYQLHHFKCPDCIAAGKGYGLRCGTGAALYTAYSDATQRTTP